MLRSVSTPAFVLYDSTVFLVSPFDIRRPIRNGVRKWSRPNRPLLSIFAVLCESNCRAPNTNTIISNELRLRTHTHKDPLTALAIGVSSSVDLSVGEQERAEAAPKETSFELRLAALIDYIRDTPVISRILPIKLHRFSPYTRISDR